MFCKGNIIDASNAGLLKIVEYYINNETNINDVDEEGKFVNVNVMFIYLQISKFSLGWVDFGHFYLRPKG